jgi:predicted lipase
MRNYTLELVLETGTEAREQEGERVKSHTRVSEKQQAAKRRRMRKFNSARHYPTILLIFYSIQSPVQEAELNRPLQNQHKGEVALV